MGTFNNCKITDIGFDLISKVNQGILNLEISKVQIGDGDYTDNEVLETKTALKSPKLLGTIERSQIIDESTLQINAQFSNSNVETGFEIKELGIFARNENNEDVLYALCVSILPDYLPSKYNNPVTIIEYIKIRVANASTVVLDYANPVYAPQVHSHTMEDLPAEVPQAIQELADFKTEVETTYVKKTDIADIGGDTYLSKAEAETIYATKTSVSDLTDPTVIATSLSELINDGETEIYTDVYTIKNTGIKVKDPRAFTISKSDGNALFGTDSGYYLNAFDLRIYGGYIAGWNIKDSELYTNLGQYGQGCQNKITTNYIQFESMLGPSKSVSFISDSQIKISWNGINSIIANYGISTTGTLTVSGGATVNELKFVNSSITAKPKISFTNNLLKFETVHGSTSVGFELYKDATSTTSYLRPTLNGITNLGHSSYKWNTVYATNTAIQSDLKTKRDIQELKDATELIMALKPIQYKLKNSDTEKGRLHYGFGAQDVAEACRKLRKDLSLVKASHVVHDENGNAIDEYYDGDVSIPDEELSWSLNPVELIPVLWKVMQTILKNQ